MTAITHAYDLLRLVPIPSDIDALNAAFHNLKENDELRNIHLENAKKAVHVLKTKPAGDQDQAELGRPLSKPLPFNGFMHCLIPILELQAHSVMQLEPPCSTCFHIPMPSSIQRKPWKHR